MNAIVQEGDPILRQTAVPVPLEEIRSERIQRLLGSMKEALSDCEDGVALAAPQIGESVRIFVVSPKAFAEDADLSNEHLVYINPTITKLSSKKVTQEEGCLSVRSIYGLIDRSEKATVEAYDEHGKKFSRGASGLLAEIFQHEIDHLNGILFIDTATDLRKIPPKKAGRETHNLERKEKIQFIFFGTPEFAVHVLDELEAEGYLPAAVVTAPDKPTGKKKIVTPPPTKIWATERGIPVLQPEKLDSDFSDVLRATFHVPLFVVAAYGKIIPKAILDIPKHGALNVHPSLLPKYRGASPIQSALLAGDKETGVTIMLMDDKMDHGPIIASESVEIDPGTTYEKLESLLARVGGKLLADMIREWIDGNIQEVEQDHSKATFTKKIITEDGLIDLSKPIEADRKVRAFNPNPGAYILLRKNDTPFRVKILSGSIKGDQYVPDRVIPEGRKETRWKELMKGAEYQVPGAEK